MADIPDLDQRQRDGVRERHHVLQGEGRHPGRLQCGRLQRLLETPSGHHLYHLHPPQPSPP